MLLKLIFSVRVSLRVYNKLEPHPCGERLVPRSEFPWNFTINTPATFIEGERGYTHSLQLLTLLHKFSRFDYNIAQSGRSQIVVKHVQVEILLLCCLRNSVIKRD